MATSRTGTTRYKNWRKLVLAKGRRDGVTHCPRCRRWMDYDNTLRPNSAEPDHRVPWARGGRETVDNGRVLCRLCNQQLGNLTARGRRSNARAQTIDFEAT